MENRDKIMVICGPSGAGKSTIIKFLLAKYPDLELSISATTRNPRGNEKHGVEYYFLDPESFRTRIESGDFIEYEEVYADLYYGTMSEELQRIRSLGHVPLLDLDVKGAANLKEKFPLGFFVFIHPGSVEVLGERLRARGTDDAHTIEKRLQRASFEMEFANRFDYVLYNYNLSKAESEIFVVTGDYLK